MVAEEAGVGAVMTTEVTLQVEAVTEIIAPVQIEASEHGSAVEGAGLGAGVVAGAGAGVTAEAGAGAAAGVLGATGAEAGVQDAIVAAAEAAAGAPGKRDDVSLSLIRWRYRLLKRVLNLAHLNSPKSHKTWLPWGQRMLISPRSLIALIPIHPCLHLTIPVQLVNLKV